MMGMVVDVESLANDCRDAFSGPQIGRETRGLSPLEEDACERLHSRLGQLRWSPRRRFRPQAFETVASDDRLPSTN